MITLTVESMPFHSMRQNNYTSTADLSTSFLTRKGTNHNSILACVGSDVPSACKAARAPRRIRQVR